MWSYIIKKHNWNHIVILSSKYIIQVYNLKLYTTNKKMVLQKIKIEEIENKNNFHLYWKEKKNIFIKQTNSFPSDLTLDFERSDYFLCLICSSWPVGCPGGPARFPETFTTKFFPAWTLFGEYERRMLCKKGPSVL